MAQSSRYPRVFHADDPVALKRELESLVDALRTRDIELERAVELLAGTVESGLVNLQAGQVATARGAAATQFRLPRIDAETMRRSCGVVLLGGAVAVEVYAATDQFIEGVDVLTLTAGVPGLVMWMATETGWWTR